ncbi:MAG: YczE/YyaS/YitT family protein [Bacilli bacterium]
MIELKKDLKKLPQVMIGIVMLGLGIWFFKESGLGLAPWDCFTQGLSNFIPLTFGQLTQVSGIVILLIAIWLKVYPGIGTVLNIVCMGIFYDLFNKYLDISSEVFAINIIYVIIGSLLMSVGIVTYMSTGLGQGPRDSVILGIHRKYTIKYGFIKFGIEAVILTIGIILGGSAGIGTVLSLFFISFFIQEILNKTKIDPKKIDHRYFQDYKF